MALHVSSGLVAVQFGIRDPAEGEKTQDYIFMIKALDGGHYKKDAIKLELSTKDNRWYSTQSSAMFFTDYNTVLIGWYMNMETTTNPEGICPTSSGCDYGARKDYDGRLYLAQFNVVSNNFSWYKRFETFFG